VQATMLNTLMNQIFSVRLVLDNAWRKWPFDYPNETSKLVESKFR